MRVLIQPGSGVVGHRVSLDENEIHHLRVRRARDREMVEVLDGRGLVGTGRLLQSGRQWLVEIQTAHHEERAPETTLAVAAGDRDRFSWMVEKAVELGVTRIVPIQTARSANVATGLKDSHLRRLRRLTQEAIKQCGAPWGPQVEEPVALSEFVRREEPGSRWLADARGSPAPLILNQSPLILLIGPEGGFTEGERFTLNEAAFQPVTLGPHTLRFETAALAAVAAANQARMRGHDA